ncbi:hypothetical protein LCGC14_2764700 [marine sediment metagenome]|uniref:Uncharacterized protein n=1 Tax=marine sediment metagenome TaxID=412755 RepID=A0A0F9B6J3_9ZZZZ
MSTDKDNWIINKSEEIALRQTGWEFSMLGSHMQMMCFIKAEEEYADYYADQLDHTYEQVKDQRMK